MGARTFEQTEFRDEALRFLNLLWLPDDARELRIIKHNKYNHTASGYFSDPEALVEAAGLWDGRNNVYVTLNPVNPALLARANQRIDLNASATTTDGDIPHRTWFFLDVDPVRPSGITSTDAEVDAAHHVLDRATEHLTDLGWPAPAIALSGNGFYALYHIDLPNDDDSLALVSAVLSALATRFNTDQAKIDTSVSNAGRLIGLVGSMKVKGDPLPDRPHRRSQLLSVPDSREVVSVDLLRAVGGLQDANHEDSSKAATRSVFGFVTPNLTLKAILEQHGFAFREQPPDANGVTWYHLHRCPFHDDGRDFECGVGQKLPDGPFAGHCFHPEGIGRGWQEFKRALGISPISSDLRLQPNTVGAIAGDAHSKPQILTTNRHLHDIAADAWTALLAANDPPVLFQHGGALVELRYDDEGLPHIEPLSHDSLLGRLDRIAIWLKALSSSELVPARPPKDVVDDMLALPEPVPVLRGITTLPVFAPDGRLCTQPGYDPATKLVYAPVGVPLPEVPLHPTPEDVARAVRLLLFEWLGDFPFVNPASRAQALAGPLSALLRECIEGPTPLFGIDAPYPGSGKSLLAQVLGIVIAGGSVAVMTFSRSEEEMRKRITAKLREGHAVILIDNVKRPIDSPPLAAVLTTTVWSDRLLGANIALHLPNRSLWYVTGNNLAFDTEVARRTVRIRLDARVDRPWERTGFRHLSLPVWTSSHRPDLVHALLVLVRHWFDLGRPQWTGRPLGTFESWSYLIGGVLETAGIPGFLADQEDLYRAADVETEEWRDFVSEWWVTHRDRPAKSTDLLRLAQDSGLLPSFFTSLDEDASDRAISTKFGLALAKRTNNHIGDFVVRRLQNDTHQRGAVYRLEPAPEGTPIAEPWPVSPQGSAEVQHENAPISGTNAEPSEPLFNLQGEFEGKSEERGVHEEKDTEIGDQVPKVQQVPTSGTNSPPFGAEPRPEVQQSDPEVPKQTVGPIPVEVVFTPCHGGCGRSVTTYKCTACATAGVDTWLAQRKPTKQGTTTLVEEND